MSKWHSIDTVGNLFPAVQGEDNSSFFRLAVVLRDEVDKTVLQEAVEAVYQRFSFFFVRLRQGVFWNYLEESRDTCIVQLETALPCSPLVAQKGKSNLIRFLYNSNRIVIEVSHIITDGTGCFELLKSLLHTYFTLKGFDIDGENKVISIHEIPTIKDYESSFTRYAQCTEAKRKNILKKHTLKNSYRIKGSIPINIGTHVISGVISVEKVRAVAKKHSTTITGFLASLLMFSIYSARIKYEKNKHPLVVAIPVNLRNIFPSETMRNFFAVPNVSFTFKHDTRFEDVISSVNKQMNEIFLKENLEQEISQYTALEKNWIAQFVPLKIKNALIRLAFSLWGETKKTITFTNLGLADFPTGLRDFVELVEVVLYPTKLSPMNMAVASFLDRLTISFSLAILETDIIRLFFSMLQDFAGANVYIYSTKGDLE